MPVSDDIKKLGKFKSGGPKESVQKFEDRLVEATHHGQTHDIKALLDMGVDPNCCGGDDNVMPLHIVAARGDMVIFDILYRTNKLNLDAVSRRGTPALIIGVTSMQEDFVRAMVRRGADVNKPDRFLRTPLHHAVFTLQIIMMEILLDNGCDRNPIDVFDCTPLSIAAVDIASFDMVRTLVESGGAVNFHRGLNVLPFILELTLHCTDKNRVNIAEYLLKNGLEMNAIDPYTGRNALHLVAITNNVAMAKLLLDYGTIVTVKDAKSLYPYEIARQHKNHEVADFLEEAHVERRASLWALGMRQNQTTLPTLINFYDEDDENFNY